MQNKNSGYVGYSMSRRAVEAYQNGEKPMSRWTKAEIIQAIGEIDENKAELFKKVTLSVLKEKCLCYASWHHTSEKCNRTDFYAIDEEYVINITEEEIKNLSKNKKSSKQEIKAETFRGEIHYLEWGGTRNHQKATEKTLENVNIEKRGSFYYVTDDNGKELLKKKIDSRGTRVVNYAEETKKQEKKNIEARLTRELSDPKALKLVEEWDYKLDASASGHVYKAGRKPSRCDYECGIENYFHIGEKRLIRDSHRYGEALWDFAWIYIGVEVWNGKEWVKE